VTNLASSAINATPRFAIDKEAATNSCSWGDAKKVSQVTSGAQPVFTIADTVYIVFYKNRDL
jgi:hypothetical protein